MPRKPIPLKLSPEQRTELERWSRGAALAARDVFRARIILRLADGLTNAQAATNLGTRAATVSKWRGRFVREGLTGLNDAPRSGRPPQYDETDTARILAQLDEPPPQGYSSWNGRLLAEALDDISPRQVWRVLADCGIDLQRRRPSASG